MNKELTGDFLPLGTIVRLQDTENDEQLYFIIARAITRSADDTVIPRYRVAPHPYGDIPSQEILTIEGNQIVEVVFKGYEDQEDQVLLDSLFDKMQEAEKSGSGSKAKKPTASRPAKPTADDKEQLGKDPFYKFKQK